MKTLWCWRCRADTVMLDDEEFEEFLRRFYECAPNAPKDGERPLPAAGGVRAQWAPVLTWFEAMTGFAETNVMAIWHHRASDYGPPCARCTKPLRTPRAKVCAACGLPRPLPPP